MSEFSQQSAVGFVQDADVQWSPPEVEPVEATGDPHVDAVVESLGVLDDLPVAGHVAVFEQAHDSLRRTLAGGPPNSTRDSPAVRS